MRALFTKLYSIFLFLMISFPQQLSAQGPTNIPTGEPEPVPFTLPNILIFIVAPVLLFIFYIWWLKQKRKEREAELERKNEESKAERKDQKSAGHEDQKK